jgi:3-methyladenine DNA glycosylase AlkC
MAEPLKNMFFKREFFASLVEKISTVYDEFNGRKFLNLVFDKDWAHRELKDRMRHVSKCLRETLPADYTVSLNILREVAPSFRGFDAMIFPDFVECFGLEEWDLSLRALEEFNRCCSSEFAIRPFLEKDLQEGIKMMLKWSESDDPHLRRLASEGCRPRLPWAMALPRIKKDPSPIIPILERLKDDPSESVRRSVANNLNDISKDNPDIALNICRSWYGENHQRDKLVKHACRDMLKSGNKEALIIFDFGDPSKIHVSDLHLNKESISIAEELQFSFRLNVNTVEPCKVRLEYRIYYMKASGKLVPKIFQIKEGRFQPGEQTISRKRPFVRQTTRKLYPGLHKIAIVVNGEEKSAVDFHLGE